MKTKIVIEIETPDKDKIKLLPLELIGTPEEEWSIEQRKAANDMKENYPSELHYYIINHILDYFKESLEETAIDGMEEVYIEDYDSFEDYGIKVTVVRLGEKG